MNRIGIESNERREREKRMKRGIIHKRNANGQTESTNETNKLNEKMSYKSWVNEITKAKIETFFLFVCVFVFVQDNLEDNVLSWLEKYKSNQEKSPAGIYVFPFGECHWGRSRGDRAKKNIEWKNLKTNTIPLMYPSFWVFLFCPCSMVPLVISRCSFFFIDSPPRSNTRSINVMWDSPLSFITILSMARGFRKQK